MSNEQPTGERGRWIFRDGQLVPHAKQKSVNVAPYVHKDEVDAFENPVTGEMETSMSTYRRKLKEHGYFEKGNDRMSFKPPSKEEKFLEIREAALEAERQIKYGMAKSTSEEREIWEKQQRDMNRRG